MRNSWLNISDNVITVPSYFFRGMKTIKYWFEKRVLWQENSGVNACTARSIKNRNFTLFPGFSVLDSLEILPPFSEIA